ncbi:MAG TPA: hypothetical protein VHO24_18640 [Opitutaceae bacterium]|nr:hypothetical protein [Opitutaceae bacterium]
MNTSPVVRIRERKRAVILFLILGLAGTAWAGPADKIYSAAVLRELTDVSIAGINKRLGPDYAACHPGGVTETFPEIYLAPSKKLPPEAGQEATREWQLGGPYRQDSGDYSSTQGQVIYMADRPLAMEGEPKMPNDGIGVDRVTIIEMSHHCFTEKPQAPWWGDGFRPDPTTKRWIDVAGADKIGRPIATARGMGNWANCGLTLFSSGFVGVAGTVTAHHTNPTFQFPKTKVPTAISITNKNEMALVTVIDTETMKGQVAVFALSVNGKVTAMPHEWGDEHAMLPNVASFVGIKLLGYVDLPGLDLPTGICAVGNRIGGRVNGRDGNAGMLSEYNLSVQSDRDQFYTGHNKEYTCTAGFAVVISKHEAKVAFLDLQPLFTEVRNAYFTTEENFQKTRNRGSAPDQWPYTFEFYPAWKPVVVKVLDVPHPTAVLATMSWGEGNRAFVASVDGTLTTYQLGGLSTEAPADPNAIVATGTGKIGRNPTQLLYDKYGTAHFLAVCRGDREIDWVNLAAGDRAVVSRRLRDSRLIDPVYAEVSDTHGIETPILTVADYNGRKILNYRYGTLTFATQGGEKFGMGPAGTDEFECGGILEFPGHPFGVSATNVN